MSYTDENKKIRGFVHQAPEKKIRSPRRLQYEKKVPLDNAFPCSYKEIIDPKFKGELMPNFDVALSGILTEAEIAAGLQSCQAADSFDYKTFFVQVCLNSKSKDQLTKVFRILDQDRSGFIEEDELKLFLNFSASARALTDAKTKAFLAAGDSDGDGKIGVDEFQALVKP
ncbi:LOW QUALITY PROTEIN: parvalbumin beta-like [Cariama cristata]